MAEAGRRPLIHRLVEDRGISMRSGAGMLDALLAGPRPADAVMFTNDYIAFGALAECARRGIAVPGRLAIAGFGDFEVARECHPALTTVRIPGREMGRRAATLILDRLAGRPAPPRVDLGFEVVLRDSA